MLVRDVPDLVPEHAREFGLVLGEAERTAGDVHDPAGRRERVDAVGIEHDERPVEVRPLGLLRERRPKQRDVLVDRGILHDAEAFTNFRADVFADLTLLGVADREVVDFLLRLLRFLERAANPAKLCKRRNAEREQCSCEHDLFHDDVSRPVTSKMATGSVLPLTTTSPSGR